MSQDDRIGNFVLHRVLHEGGCCTYHLATHFDEGSNPGPYILAQYYKSLLMDQASAVGLRVAMERRAGFAHPRVSALLDHGPAHAVFEYVPGVSARVLESRASEAGGRLPLDIAARIAMEVAEVADATSDALGVDAVDIDLGSVRVGWDDRVSLTLPLVIPNHGIQNESSPPTAVVRHPSPEAVRGEATTKRSLVFQIGVLLYRLVESRNPFQGSSPMETFMRIVDARPDPLAHPSPELDAILSRALARDPARRFEGPRALASAIERQLSPARPAMVGETTMALCASERRDEEHIFEDFADAATMTSPDGPDAAESTDEPTIVDEDTLLPDR